ncbi:MAG: 2-C-methyl-D-erythritol 2,4-cyclodiphosphate synthase [Candidatus Omnitrophica bacterium]|nr:2-C-methyl-D-erythritol 2,4-cyclodiphosphate synthase [Candidatus Omnitrophota bacterium]
MDFRVGLGYDIHRLVENRRLILGGVGIPGPRGLLGHSDADALLHALADALLGAAGFGDIGEHFPDTDPAYHDASSADLLAVVRRLVSGAGYALVNIDATIVAQSIKMAPHKAAIRSNIARLLEIREDMVNIKAKTKEGLDAVGADQAIAVSCVVLLRR